MGMQGFSVAEIVTGAGARDGWQVLADGLEHGRTGYFIARHEIAKRRSDGLWMWPVHVLEKDWVAEDEFAAAFRLALAAYGISADAALAASFREHEARFVDDAGDVPVPRERVTKTKAGSARRRRAVAPAAPAAKGGGRGEAAKTRSIAK